VKSRAAKNVRTTVHMVSDQKNVGPKVVVAPRVVQVNDRVRTSREAKPARLRRVHNGRHNQSRGEPLRPTLIT
jgi:hypothetical protein